uniref:(northern house mosquito) hypothetical protein n=1 Tax=Culex pipiens TaxID=7175 RepID=A0A8D8DHY2_CULPI
MHAGPFARNQPIVDLPAGVRVQNDPLRCLLVCLRFRLVVVAIRSSRNAPIRRHQDRRPALKLGLVHAPPVNLPVCPRSRARVPKSTVVKVLHIVPTSPHPWQWLEQRTNISLVRIRVVELLRISRSIIDLLLPDVKLVRVNRIPLTFLLPVGSSLLNITVVRKFHHIATTYTTISVLLNANA